MESSEFPTKTPKLHTLILSVGFAVVFLVVAWVLHWNEFDSPWGAANQAVKLEMLKAQLCK